MFRLKSGREVRLEDLPGEMISVTRCGDELSVVCCADWTPVGASKHGGLRCLRVRGPLDFSLTGVLCALLEPLAQAQVPVLTLSKSMTIRMTFGFESLAVTGTAAAFACRKGWGAVSARTASDAPVPPAAVTRVCRNLTV